MFKLVMFSVNIKFPSCIAAVLILFNVLQVVSSSPGIAVEDKRDDNQMQSVTGEAEATVLYAATEMSSTDDEGEPGTTCYIINFCILRLSSPRVQLEIVVYIFN